MILLCVNDDEWIEILFYVHPNYLLSNVLVHDDHDIPTQKQTTSLCEISLSPINTNDEPINDPPVITSKTSQITLTKSKQISTKNIVSNAPSTSATYEIQKYILKSIKKVNTINNNSDDQNFKENNVLKSPPPLIPMTTKINENATMGSTSKTTTKNKLCKWII